MTPHEKVTAMFADSIELLDIAVLTQRIDAITDALMEHKRSGGVADAAWLNLMSSVNAQYNIARSLMPVSPIRPTTFHDNSEIY